MAEGIQETVELDAPPEEVWELLMDPGRLGDWVGPHRKLEDVPELPLKTGDRFRQRLGFGPIAFWVTWEVVEAERPSRARWVGEGPKGTKAEAIYELSPSDSGTTFHYTNDYELPGGIAGATARKAFSASAGGREARKSLKRLTAIFNGA